MELAHFIIALPGSGVETRKVAEMNWDALGGLLVVFAILMLLVQRTEPNRRRFVFVIGLVVAEVVRRYIVYRGWEQEGWWALGGALLANVLFWVVVGRSNPPRSSAEEIEVLGNE